MMINGGGVVGILGTLILAVVAAVFVANDAGYTEGRKVVEDQLVDEGYLQYSVDPKTGHSYLIRTKDGSKFYEEDKNE